MSDSITTIYLVRHGETDWNASGRFQGTTDVPMNLAGRAQVAALARELADIAFDAAYTSPLGRTRDTAAAILGARPLEVTVVDDLVELSYGDLQGTDASAWTPEFRSAWERQPWSITFPNGESLKMVQARAVPALQRIVAAHPGETVLVSSHGHLNRVLAIHALERPLEDFWKIEQANASVLILRFPQANGNGTRHVRERATLSLAAANRAMAAKTKPLGALGRLEDVAVRLSMLQGTLAPQMDKLRVCVFGADHGVGDEGVSAYPRAVTGEMMRNFDRGGAAINVIAAANGIDVEVIDVGVDADLSALTRVRHERVRAGSRNLAREAAMTDEELDAALAVGAAAARRAHHDGVRAIGLGEMGIANTTSAAAILSALTGRSAVETVGRGTGVDDSALAHKRTVVDAAVLLHFAGHKATGREALRRLGGLEIAAIAGSALEAAARGIAVVADGFISTVGVLCALLIQTEAQSPAAEPQLADALFFAHRSTEHGHALAIEHCARVGASDTTPLLDLGLRLGEGTGAALALPLLRAAAAVMRDMATFADAGVSAGEHAEDHAGPATDAIR